MIESGWWEKGSVDKSVAQAMEATYKTSCVCVRGRRRRRRRRRRRPFLEREK